MSAVGIGVLKNVRKALRWLYKAAKLGNAKAKASFDEYYVKRSCDAAT